MEPSLPPVAMIGRLEFPNILSRRPETVVWMSSHGKSVLMKRIFESAGCDLLARFSVGGSRSTQANIFRYKKIFEGKLQ